MRKDKKSVAQRVVQVALAIFIAAALLAAFVVVTQGRDIPVLNPEGTIAKQQLTLILITTGLGIFVVIPVFILLFTIAWKYREGNTKAQYQPEFHGNAKLEVLWWGIPILIILVLAVITWVSTHALDPYKPLESDKRPVEVQVISLEWKWLFIYPEQGIATVNYMNIPEGTPINLSITSDAPMNSFWVPALAGQVYAMTGMTTKLHLAADTTGSYNGASANLSGDGYAGMRFKVNSLTSTEFEDWVRQSTNADDWLTVTSYNELRQPSKDNKEKTFGLVQGDIFNKVVVKYMAPSASHQTKTQDHETTKEHQ